MASKLKIANNKRLPTKHFMSTTISAASKAAVPKKKILAQRNETLDVEEQPRLSRSLSFDSKASRLPVVDVHDDVQNNLSVDSPLQPYDPINNYLSPRPRFLRYDPDRRRKIFVRQENVTRVRRSASFDAGMPFSGEELESGADNLSGACPQEEPIEEVEKIIDKEVGKDEGEGEDEDEKEDDFEEESGWSSNTFLKYLLVMIVLILTTLAISSMNSPTLSPAREAAKGFMDWYSKTHSSVYGAVGLNFSEVGGKVFDLTMQTDLVMGKLNKRKIDYVYEEWDKKGLVESTDELVVVHGKTEDVCQDEVGSKEGGSDQLEGLETAETEEVENNEIDANQDEMWSKEEDTEQLQGSETAESKEVEIDETENRDECSYPLQEPILAIGNERECHKIEAEKETYDQLLGADFNQNDVIEESKIVKKMVEADVSGKEDSNDNGLDEREIGGIGTTDVLIKLARFDQIFAASIGVAMLMLASFSVLYCSKQMKASPVELMVSHNNSTEIKKLEAFAYPSSLMHKTQDKYIVNPTSLMLHPMEKEASKETSYIHPPTVELLSEFVIGGGEVTSSLRSCGTKDSNMLAEAEESNFSLSHGKKNASLIHADAVSSSQTKSSHLDLSTGGSPSYGSFTAEKMIVKKQRSKKAEVVPSPVRRSSRIHNRSVMSP